MSEAKGMIKSMKRKDLIELILTKVQAEPVFEINKELVSKKFRKTKNGIYFLYDENDIGTMSRKSTS